LACSLLCWLEKSRYPGYAENAKVEAASALIATDLARRKSVSKPCISADSHITEPPNCYIDYIDPKFRDIAPKIVRHETKGDLFVIDGMKKPLGIGLAAAAGKKPEDLAAWGATFESLHRGGWDPKARLADQDRDGVV